MKKRLITFCILLFYPSSFVFAAENSVNNNNLSSDMMKLILYLGVILGLIFLLTYFLKKKKKYGSSMYQTYGGISLGQNKSVQIVEIGGKIYILGVGEEVTLIKVLEKEDDIEAIKNSSRAIFNDSGNIVDRYIAKYRKKSEKNNLNHFEKELSEKVEQLKDTRTFSVNKFLDEEEENGTRD